MGYIRPSAGMQLEPEGSNCSNCVPAGGRISHTARCCCVITGLGKTGFSRAKVPSAYTTKNIKN